MGGGARKEAPPFSELPIPIQEATKELFDIAGFAPPANTNPVQAVLNYADYRMGPHKQMVNRLVQRAVYQQTALDTSDFHALYQNSGHIPDGEIWPVSALFLADPLVAEQTSGEQAQQFRYGETQLRNYSFLLRDKMVVDSVEMPAQSVDSVKYIADRFTSPGRRVYIEAPVDGQQLTDVMGAIAEYSGQSVFAKFRTGGTNPPTAEQTAHFMILAALKGVGYKLTGRLHGLVAHTVTEIGPDGNPYEIEESGYLNVVLAAEFARRAKEGTAPYQRIIDVLNEKDITAFEITNDGIRYKGHHISTQDIIKIRRTALHSIGSCSFEEPVGELSKLPLAA